MQNTKRLLTCCSLIGLSLLAGCVYKIDIQQGNIVSQDMVDMLQPGMNRSQTRFVMGTPLIADTFHPDRWDYIYTIQPGGGRRLQEREALFFNASAQLSGLSGDFQPGMSRDEVILSEQNNVIINEKIISPSTERKPTKPGSLEEQIQIEVDHAEVIEVPTPEPLDSNGE